MKKIISLIIALTMTLSIFSVAGTAFADDAPSGYKRDGFEFTFHADGTVYIKGYCGKAVKELTVPAQINGKTVKSVSLDKTDSELRKAVEKITIENGPENLMSNAIHFFDNLESLVIPDSVKRLETFCVSNCEKLSDVSIGSGVEYIGWSVFDSTKFMEDMASSGKLVCYKDNYLLYCDQLNDEVPFKVKVKSGTKAIAEGAFVYGYLQSITLTEGIKYLPSFAGCNYITTVKIPESVTVIPRRAFIDCYHLKSIVIPNGVKKIYRNTFSRCAELESVTLPDGLTLIGKYAFSRCKSLKRIKIPDSVKTISKCAFTRSGIESITIPAGVEKIGNNPFSYCKKLKQIKISKTNKHFYIKKGGLYRSKDGTLVWKK